MRKSLLVFFLLLSQVAFSQIKDISFSLSANYPVIGSVTKNNNTTNIIDPTSGYTSYYSNIGSVKEKYNTDLGVNFSFDFQATQFGKYFIRTGLGLQYYRYQRSSSVDLANQGISLPISILPGTISGSPYGVIFGSGYVRDADGSILIDPQTGFPILNEDPILVNVNAGKATSVYMLIPLTIGRKFLKDRLVVSAGASASFIMYASEVKNEFSATNGIQEYKDKSTKGYNVLVNGVADVTYLFFKQVGIKLSYQRSLNPIYKSDYQIAGKTYLNLFSAGITFQPFN